MSSQEEEEKGPGIVYLVGAGPGRMDLITVRGQECIQMADVVIYDRLSNEQMLSWARSDAELVYVGKKCKEHTMTQEEIHRLMEEHAQAGKTVCRLKGGDPTVFGRGGEEGAALREAGIPFEIVPGISSALAAPLYAGIPLTRRGDCSQLTIFTGHDDPEKGASSLDYRQIAEAEGSKVMLMGVHRIESIAEALQKEGMPGDTPVALVRWATTGCQQTLEGTLDTIAEKVTKQGFKPPAVAVFGDVVKRRAELNWFEELPLFGKRIVVTRPRKQAGKLSKQLRDLGAEVLELPTIRIEPPREMLEFAQLVQDAHSYDWLIFTSPNGAESFFNAFFKIYADAREIGGVSIAAMGPATVAKIREHHLDVDLVPEKSVAESLADAFEEKVGSVDNLKVLWVKAEETRDVLSQRLLEKGAILDEALAYRTVAETEARSGAASRFREEGADIITFTSSSSVEHFLDLRLPLPEKLKIVSIGPITSQTLLDHGLYVDAEAETHDLSGLVQAIRNLVS